MIGAILFPIVLLLQTVIGFTQSPYAGELACPLDSCAYITQGFTENHHADDFAMPIGSPIYAAADGVIYRAGINCSTNPCANAVTMLHDDGWLATNYWHLDEVYVHAGDRVSQGDVIGTVGMTGITTGPHLHFSVQVYRVFVNPLDYLDRGLV